MCSQEKAQPWALTVQIRASRRSTDDLLEADFSLPILIANWKFLDTEAFGQDWQDLLANRCILMTAKAGWRLVLGAHPNLVLRARHRPIYSGNLLSYGSEVSLHSGFFDRSVGVF